MDSGSSNCTHSFEYLIYAQIVQYSILIGWFLPVSTIIVFESIISVMPYIIIKILNTKTHKKPKSPTESFITSERSGFYDFDNLQLPKLNTTTEKVMSYKKVWSLTLPLHRRYGKFILRTKSNTQIKINKTHICFKKIITVTSLSHFK